MTAARLSFVLTGMAIFAMFFGAGNVVFPLTIGQATGADVNYAVFGLLLTGIILPLTGLVSMILFNGDYYAFFNRLGKLPGLFCILLIMALIGPFAGMPRTITLAYSTLSQTAYESPFWVFNVVFCSIIAILAYRRDAVLVILGKILTPLLLTFLAAVIIIGFVLPANTTVDPTQGPVELFTYGFITGYNTMDMLAALFFSTVVLAGLHAKLSDDQNPVEHHILLSHLLKAVVISGLLLFIVYGGFCLVAARHADTLSGVAPDLLLGSLSIEMLGDKAGFLANGVVTIACLTTAVTLASVFAEFLSHFFFNDPDKAYKPFVIVTVLMAFAVSFFGFVKIVEFIFPIIALCYPFLIVLALVNIAYKLFGFKMVKTPVVATLLITVLVQYVL